MNDYSSVSSLLFVESVVRHYTKVQCGTTLLCSAALHFSFIAIGKRGNNCRSKGKWLNAVSLKGWGGRLVWHSLFCERGLNGGLFLFCGWINSLFADFL